MSMLTRQEQDFFNDLRHDVIKLTNKIDSLEQKIINVDAKYKFKLNEIMLCLEELRDNKPIWNALQNVESRVNAIEDAVIIETEQENNNGQQTDK